MKGNRKKIIGLVLVIVILGVVGIASIVGSSGEAPFVRYTTKKIDGIYMKWGADIPSANVTNYVDFDGQGDFNMDTGVGYYDTKGNQSVVNEGYTGKGMQCKYNMGKWSNNAWNAEESDYAHAIGAYTFIPEARFMDVKNHEYFSISFKMKTKGTVKAVQFSGDVGQGRNLLPHDDPHSMVYLGEKIHTIKEVNQGQTTIPVTNAAAFSPYIGRNNAVWFSPIKNGVAPYGNWNYVLTNVHVYTEDDLEELGVVDPGEAPVEPTNPGEGATEDAIVNYNAQMEEYNQKMAEYTPKKEEYEQKKEYYLDGKKGTIGLHTGVPYFIEEGFELTCTSWHMGIVLRENRVDTNNEWHTVSLTGKIDVDEYNCDIEERGFLFSMLSEVDQKENVLWLDDIKYGRSPFIRIFRDGEELEMTTEQHYGTEFTDSEALDKAPPSVPVVLNTEINDDQIVLSWDDCVDYPTIYTYELTNTDMHGNQVGTTGEFEEESYTSGVKTYAVYINDVLYKKVEEPMISIPITKSGIIEVSAIDACGNESERAEIGVIELTAKANEEDNCMEISWTNPDNSPYVYDIYRKLPEDSNFKTLKSNYTGTSYKDTYAGDKSKPDDTMIKSALVTDGLTGEVVYTYKEIADSGSLYQYYVRGRRVSDNAELVSNIDIDEVTSGVAGYSYVIDNKSDTVPDGVVDTVQTSVKAYIDLSKNTYFHLKGMDKAGNLTSVVHCKIGDDFNPSITCVIKEGITEEEKQGNEGYLYAHRRPLAEFYPDIVKRNDVITSIKIPDEYETSKDLDHEHTHSTGHENKVSYKGIRAWRWGYRSSEGIWVDETFDAVDYGTALKARESGLKWINDSIEQVVDNTDEITRKVSIMLSVRDIDGEGEIGEWSDIRVIEISNDPLPPVAKHSLNGDFFKMNEVDYRKDSEFIVSNLSYDPNGDEILKSRVIITAPNGSTIYNKTTDGKTIESKMIWRKIRDWMLSNKYSMTNNKFSISLQVWDDSKYVYASDIYKTSFYVYFDSIPPELDPNIPGGKDNPPVEDPEDPDDYTDVDPNITPTIPEDESRFDTNMVYLEDPDRYDNYGKTRGRIKFSNLTVSNPCGFNLKYQWVFDGESVTKRTLFSGINMMDTKVYNGKIPFSNTVTEQGFKPGAYRITLTASGVTSVPYEPDTIVSSMCTTYSDKEPYHMYVVPAIEMDSHFSYKGVIDQGRENINGVIENVDSIVNKYDSEGKEMDDILVEVGEPITFFSDTNQYVDKVVVRYFDEELKEYQEVDMEMVSQDSLTKKKHWEITMPLPDSTEGKEIITSTQDYAKYSVRIKAYTKWGSEDGTPTRVKHQDLPMLLLPVKLYDFKVTSLTDPTVFDKLKEISIVENGGELKFESYKYLEKLYKGKEPLSVLEEKVQNGEIEGYSQEDFYVGKLPIDESSTSNGKLVRKGYSFNFMLTSRGLKKDNCFIGITPKLYALPETLGEETELRELDGYVLDETDGKMKCFTSGESAKNYEIYTDGNKEIKIGNHSYLKLTKSVRTLDGSEQFWIGRYGLPSMAEFKIKGTNELWDGKVLIAFQFEGYKDGKNKYDYIKRNQWLREKEKYGDTKEYYDNIEENWRNSENYIGAVIVWNNKESVNDDYRAKVTWVE